MKLKALIAIFALFTLNCAGLFAQTKVMNEEILMQLKRVGEPKISPDGQWIAYTVQTPDVPNNKSNIDIFITSIDGKTSRQLTNTPGANVSPIFMPDGKSIIFLSSRSGSQQAYQVGIDGVNAKQITNLASDIDNLGLSNDGKNISFTMEVKTGKTPQDKYPQYKKVNVRFYESLPTRHWDVWEDEFSSHLFVMPISGGEPKDVMPGEAFDTPLRPSGGAEQIAWSIDGTEIAYTCKKDPDYVLNTNSDVYVYNLATGETKNISKGLMGYDMNPVYSPDGKYIAFISLERNGFESDRRRIMLYDRKTGKNEELTKTLDQWVDNYVWAPDSKSIYFDAEEGAVVQLHQIQVPKGDWKILTKGWDNYDGNLSISPKGDVIAIGRRNMNRPTEIYTFGVKDAAIKQVTDFNGEICKDIKPVKYEERWITSKDGSKVQCWIVFPPDFDKTKKYPMITYLQGGPQSTISQYFSYRWNYATFASNGYVIVMANRRGVPGFGQKWNDAISKDWGGKPMEDVLAATDEMLKEPYIDKNRVCAIGASAGGYQAYWLEGNHNGRFSAFVAHCGVFNMESMYGATEEVFFTNWENGGPYWDPQYKEYYEKNSPHKFAANWNTPILISTGERDYRIPYTQSLEAFQLAQLKRIPSKIISFPEMNHWILKPQEQIVWYKEVFEFLDKYCKNKK